MAVVGFVLLLEIVVLQTSLRGIAVGRRLGGQSKSEGQVGNEAGSRKSIQSACDLQFTKKGRCLLRTVKILHSLDNHTLIACMKQ